MPSSKPNPAKLSTGTVGSKPPLTTRKNLGEIDGSNIGAIKTGGKFHYPWRSKAKQSGRSLGWSMFQGFPITNGQNLVSGLPGLWLLPTQTKCTILFSGNTSKSFKTNLHQVWSPLQKKRVPCSHVPLVLTWVLCSKTHLKPNILDFHKKLLFDLWLP